MKLRKILRKFRLIKNKPLQNKDGRPKMALNLEEIIRRRNDGEKVSALATRYNCSQSLIYKVIQGKRV